MRGRPSILVIVVTAAAAILSAGPVTVAAGSGVKATPGKTLRLKAPNAKRADIKLVPASRRRGCKLLACDGALLHGLRPRRGSVRVRWPAYYQRCVSGCTAAATASFELAAWRRGQRVIVFFLRSRSRPSGKQIGRARATIRRNGPSFATGPQPLPPPSGSGGASYLSGGGALLADRSKRAEAIAAILSLF